jgi:hypothetical protein
MKFVSLIFVRTKMAGCAITKTETLARAIDRDQSKDRASNRTCGSSG